MKRDHLGSRWALLAAAFAVAWIVMAGPFHNAPHARADDAPAAKAAHRVVVMYFHRTERCDTCKTISEYTEEAVKDGFAEEMKQATVSLHMIDFQDAKNARYTKAYKLDGPTLIIAEARDGKAAQWKKMPEVWSLVFEKPKFLEYVRDGVNDYLKGE